MLQFVLALVVMGMCIIADFFWLDYDNKRWGWFKKWSKTAKVLLFTSFGIITFIFYLATDWDNIVSFFE